MPIIPGAAEAPLIHKKRGAPTDDRKEELRLEPPKRRILKRGVKKFGGVMMKYVVLAPEPEAAMFESRMIWDDGPKIRRVY